MSYLRNGIPILEVDIRCKISNKIKDYLFACSSTDKPCIWWKYAHDTLSSKPLKSKRGDIMVSCVSSTFCSMKILYLNYIKHIDPWGKMTCIALYFICTIIISGTKKLRLPYTEQGIANIKSRSYWNFKYRGCKT